jgi:hypothetical protein
VKLFHQHRATFVDNTAMPEAPSIVPERPNRGESMTKSAVRHRARRKGLVLRTRGHAYYLTDEKGAVVAGGPWSSLKDIAAVLESMG